MLINADFSLPAVVTPQNHRWTASPQAGVERVMLDRVGEEKARATSIVRYAPGSRFPSHPHPGGEEILVLSGTFSDGGGHYGQGWYLRNPPGSAHQPFSDDGAEIFVKLWQMPADERRTVRIDTNNPAAWQALADRDICPLFSSGTEQVCLQRLAPGVALFPDALANGLEGGAEILVLAGELRRGSARRAGGGHTADDSELGSEEHGAYERGAWIRLPNGSRAQYYAGTGGATLYLKTGHLGHAPAPA